MRPQLRDLFCLLVAGSIAAGCSDSSSSRHASAAATAATTSTANTTSGGTTAPTTSSGTAPATTATITPAPGPVAGAWYKGDLHSHTATHSEDARRQFGDPTGTTVRIAERVGLDFLAGTDHRTNDLQNDPNWASNSIVLLTGMEWGGAMHAGAIGLTSPIQVNTTQNGAALKGEIDQIIASIHAQGGIFVLNHPVDDGNHLWVVEPTKFDAIEVWNSQWSLMMWEPRSQQDLDSKMSSLGLTQAGIAPSPHMVNAIADQRGTANLQALTFWESHLNSGTRVPLVGGGDRHMLFTQGYPTTHVYAAARTKQGILDGIRAGRTYVSRTPRGPKVSFRADGDGDGLHEALIGDEVPSGRAVEFRIVIEGADGGRVDLIKRGVTIRSETVLGSTFTLLVNDTPAQGDWYRVDVYEPIDPQVMRSSGAIFQLAQSTNKRALVLASLLTMVPGSALDYTWGTVLPTVIVPDQIDRVLNMSRKDQGYCRGAITSPIYVKR